MGTEVKDEPELLEKPLCSVSITGNTKAYNTYLHIYEGVDEAVMNDLIDKAHEFQRRLIRRVADLNIYRAKSDDELIVELHKEKENEK
jgi:hypothetical protein